MNQKEVINEYKEILIKYQKIINKMIDDIENINYPLTKREIELLIEKQTKQMEEHNNTSEEYTLRLLEVMKLIETTNK